MYAAEQKIPANKVESSADICLKKIYRIKDKAESLRDLSNKLNSIRMDLPLNPTTNSECQRAMPPYFNEVDTILSAIEHIIMEVYQVVESVDI